MTTSSTHSILTDPFTYKQIERRTGDQRDTGRHTSIITGYSEIVLDRIDNGWSASLVTFKFNPLPGGSSAKLCQMTDEVERVYSTFVTRVIRKPRSRSMIDRLPVLIACADLPVRKRENDKIIDVYVNDGLHFHGTLLVPPSSRLKETAEAHFVKERRRYLFEGGRLAAIHVTPIEHSPELVVDYVMKSIKSGRLQYDEAILILPKTSSELDRG